MFTNSTQQVQYILILVYWAKLESKWFEYKKTNIVILNLKNNKITIIIIIFILKLFMFK